MTKLIIFGTLIQVVIMSRRREVKAVLDNFLQTFTSRYSDFDGYWLFGFLVNDIDGNGLTIDLLNSNTKGQNTTPLDLAQHLATQKFIQQLSKAGLPRLWFKEAFLNISKSPTTCHSLVNGRSVAGYELKFSAHTVTDLGRVYMRTILIFVAPHNPTVEWQSSRVY